MIHVVVTRLYCLGCGKSSAAVVSMFGGRLVGCGIFLCVCVCVCVKDCVMGHSACGVAKE